MAKVRSGTLRLRGLNWLGVTTNFLILTALSAGGGLALIGLAAGYPWPGVAAGAGLVLALLLMLRIQHARATSLCRRLDDAWQHGAIPAKTLELHARKSLDSTSADVAVVVTMGAALFAGTFDAALHSGERAGRRVTDGDDCRFEDLRHCGVDGLHVDLVTTHRPHRRATTACDRVPRNNAG